MRRRVKAGISGLLALLVCSFVAIGAPPSEFVPRSSAWWYLEPVMIPALLTGPLLALLAAILSLVGVRASAVTCVVATSVSMLGLVVAWGIDAEAGLRGLLVPLAFLAVPALGALESLREASNVGSLGQATA